MKFMKLGSKVDAFQNGSNNTRFIKTELASDILVIVGEVKFYLHKFPLLSRSGLLKKIVAENEEEDEVDISAIPGGPSSFEICAKFCYGMTVTLNAYNVVSSLYAAKYLEMTEDIEKGNLIYKIEVFLTSSIFRSWKDSIIVLQSTTALPSQSGVASSCVEAVANRASVDVAKVDWSYSYNRKKLPEENGIVDVEKLRSVPKDWWVEDLCDLEIELFKEVILKIRSNGKVNEDVIGETLKAYGYRKFRNFNIGELNSDEIERFKVTVSTLVSLLPVRSGVSCSFLLKLLKVSMFLELEEDIKTMLIRKIGGQLEEAPVGELLMLNNEGEMMYDVVIVKRMLEEFFKRDKGLSSEVEKMSVLSAASKLMVAKLVDGYLGEIAKDPKLPAGKFIEIAEMVSCVSRPSHDSLYCAIDMFLKEHPNIPKSERKKLCHLINCKRLSQEASTHAVQNERLPLRLIVQILFFEQLRLSKTSGQTTPDLPNASQRSSKSTAINDDDWDALASAEELKALKGEIAALRLANTQRSHGDPKLGASEVKGLLKSKLFSKIWASKGDKIEVSGSDSSESFTSPAPEEGKCTPWNRRYSVS